VTLRAKAKSHAPLTISRHRDRVARRDSHTAVAHPSWFMSNVIPFPVRVPASETEPEIDLFTAVDVAIRDLRDIASRLKADEAGRVQATECLNMLARALASAQAVG
jgi:hypothetical protein